VDRKDGMQEMRSELTARDATEATKKWMSKDRLQRRKNGVRRHVGQGLGRIVEEGVVRSVGRRRGKSSGARLRWIVGEVGLSIDEVRFQSNAISGGGLEAGRDAVRK
jgi:hypothetical protein